MLDQNDLQAIAQLIDSKLEKQRDDILEVVDERTNSLLEIIQQQSETTQAMISESEQRMKVYVENQVGKRIDSLFDGYKPMKSNGNLKEKLSNWKNAWKLWKQRPVNFI